MDHGPAVEMEHDNASDIKARIGFVLFVIYGVVYGGFVAINTFDPQSMSRTIIFDLNLAVIYGFGLIIFAIVLGLIYNAVCNHYERQLNQGGGT